MIKHEVAFIPKTMLAPLNIKILSEQVVKSVHQVLQLKIVPEIPC